MAQEATLKAAEDVLKSQNTKAKITSLASKVISQTTQRITGKKEPAPAKTEQQQEPSYSQPQ